MGFSDFFFFFDIVFSHKQKFLGSKQAPRYTGKRVILMRVLTRLECNILTTSIYNTKPHLPDMNSLTKFEVNWSTDAQDSA